MYKYNMNGNFLMNIQVHKMQDIIKSILQMEKFLNNHQKNLY